MSASGKSWRRAQERPCHRRIAVYVEDLREEFVPEYLWPMVRAGGVYEHKYLLGTSIARPLLAKRQVEVALETRRRRAGPRLHRQGQRPGAFRADLQSARAASADHRAVARVGHRSRAKTPSRTPRKHNVPIEQTTKKIYSRDRNIWHLSHEGGELEDPANAPEEAIWQWIDSPEKAPDKPAEVDIGFEAGHSGFRQRQSGSAASAAQLAQRNALARTRCRPHRPGGKSLRRHEVARLL